jgi:hypothetical protein
LLFCTIREYGRSWRRFLSQIKPADHIIVITTCGPTRGNKTLMSLISSP